MPAPPRSRKRRQRQAKRSKLGQQHIEMPGIFGGKIAREQARLRIGAKARLDTCKVVACGAKGLQGYLKLVAFGPVLCVVNHGVRASSKRKRDVQRIGVLIWFVERRG